MEIERRSSRRSSNEIEQRTSDTELRHREDLNDMSTVGEEPKTSNLNKNNIDNIQPSKKRKKVSLTKAVNVTNEPSNPINPKKGVDLQDKNFLTAGKPGTTDTFSNNRIIQKYNNKDEGPFAVLLTIDRESNNNVPSPVEIGRFLFQCGIRFNEINKLSRFCWKVVFDSYHEANQFLENEFIKKSRYRLQIPDWMLSRCVVIRGIPTDITEKEILEEISFRNPFLRPIKAERLKRRETLNNTVELDE
ncbi:hypothetical protein PUN28_015765 [Cardiocondyla obscurior]|uniref:Uncharacterized protein n=1 Tax=Cardiocondyla obscurior TaxID=286306 RepID=A0AAW2F0M4_9HYME